jgi:hypothetical protein
VESSRHYALLDHLLEFKYVAIEALPGMDGDTIQHTPREALRALPPVQQKLTKAEQQLAAYRETLERVYGPKLKLRTHAVVGLGLSRLVW